MKAWEGLEMTNADWWARLVQARTERADLRPQRVWTLHKGVHVRASGSSPQRVCQMARG